MNRRGWLVIVAMTGASALGTGFAAHAFAKAVPDGAEGAPPRLRWEGRRVPIESALEVSPPAPPIPSAQAPPLASGRAVPPSIEPAYESCRRGFYERGIPYDFFACEQLR
jgi:hypothetical protein